MATESHSKCDFLNLGNHSFYINFLMICTYNWSGAITQSSHFQSRIQKNWACKVILFRIVSCSTSDAWPPHRCKLHEISNSWLQSHIQNTTFWIWEITHSIQISSWFAFITDLALSPNLLTFKAVYWRIELVSWYFSKLYRIQEVMLDHHTCANCIKFRIHGYRATSKIRLSEFGKSLILYKSPHDLHL